MTEESATPAAAADARVLSQLRKISFSEGISFLVLLGFAMPMKYIWDRPEFVRWVGWAHGVLFVALGVWALRAMLESGLSFKRAALLMVAALLPAGPFFMDKSLREEEARIRGGEAA